MVAIYCDAEVTAAGTAYIIIVIIIIIITLGPQLIQLSEKIYASMHP